MAFGLCLGSGGNYTGMLTKSIVFSGALIVFLASMHEILSVTYEAKDTAATGLTLASIIVPEWISLQNTTVRHCL